MKPYDYISKNGIDYFKKHISENVKVRLLSNDDLVFSGKFVGITPDGKSLPLFDGYLIELPQFNFHILVKDSENGQIQPIKFSLLLVDSMNDIEFGV